MTFVICEIGLAHMGDPVIGRALVQCAKDSGADAVKFQLYHWPTIDRPLHIREILKRYWLEPYPMARQARELGLITIVTPFGYHMLSVAERSYAFDAYKVSHAESGDLEFVETVLETGKPVYCSYAPPIIDTTPDVIPLWCCPKYPTPIDEVDWDGVKRLGGFSDHTGDVHAGAMAAQHGANVIEVHITHERNSDGPDHASAIDMNDMEEYIALIRHAEVLTA